MNAPTMSERFADDVEQALATLPTAPSPSRVFAGHPVRTLLVTVVVLAVVVPLGVFAVLASAHRSAPAGPVPVRTQGASVVIGALPARVTLVVHGTAKLVHDPALDEDLRTYAKQNGKNPDDVVRDYAGELYFDRVPDTCRKAHVSCDAAVFKPGVHGASEVRFAARPPQAAIDLLTSTYPRDLELEWGEHLITDQARDHLSGVVAGILADVPDIGSFNDGFGASGALTVDHRGSASAQAIADAILKSPAFRATYVDGQPPTEVIVTPPPSTTPVPVPSQNTTPPASEVASCAAAQVHPFTCGEFTLERAGDKSLQFQAWFDVLHGTPRLVVGESEHLRALPVRFNADGATADPVAGWTLEQRACFRDSECGLDEDVRSIFTGGARITTDGSTIRISAGSTVLVGVDQTSEAHRYAHPTEQTAGGHTLLTYHDDGGAQATAADGGRLTINKAGCLTDGLDVLVLPDTTVLHPDGSIDIGGTHVPVGGRLKLGGGEGAVPADQRCGTGGYFYGYAG